MSAPQYVMVSGQQVWMYTGQLQHWKIRLVFDDEGRLWEWNDRIGNWDRKQ